VKVSVLEGDPSILFDSARFVEGYTVGGRRSFLRDTIGIMRVMRKTGSDCIYAFTELFPETLVPCLVASLVIHRRLLFNVTKMAHAAEDKRRLLGLIRSRLRRGPRGWPLLEFAAYHVSRRLAFRIGTCLAMNRFTEEYSKSRMHARRAPVIGAGVEDFWHEHRDVPKSFDGVYVGRFDPSKRVPTLVKAWQGVVSKEPDSRLLLIGESGEEFPLVKWMVGELGLGANVVFAGFIDDRRVLADRVRSAKVFVFPSVREGFGLVIAEAMAAGLPCVLSDVEPLREVFGEAAILVKPDEPSALAEATLGLLLDEKKRQEIAARSVSLAGRFTWTAVAKKVLAAMKAQ
jgi:glycosyltransferase involved in cell wall biosynthesis